jgi:hypothetical protein
LSSITVNVWNGIYRDKCQPEHFQFGVFFMNLSPEMTVALVSLSIMAAAFLVMTFGLKVQAEEREEKRKQCEAERMADSMVLHESAK